MFGVSGGNLTDRMRKDAFEAMLKQEMGWFDKVENNTGSLCARLAGDAAKVQGATGARVGSIMQGASGCRSSHCSHHGACMFFVLPSPDYCCSL